MNFPGDNLNHLPIVDSFQRVHKNLRISVTDRCNIRCFYCMPESVKFLPASEVLSFEEIVRATRVMAEMGVDRIRITGGEPLVRSQMWKLISMLRDIDGIDDIAMTTNGVLLAEQAQSLRDAGLARLNISLDTLDATRFEQITRRKGLVKVLDGIDAARDAGFTGTRINAVSIAGLTEDDVIPLAKFSRENNLELRFIEFMPLDGDEEWKAEQVLDGETIRKWIGDQICELALAERTNVSQPAIDYIYADGSGSVGFINPVSQPFCSTCDRLRITAEGKLRNCLFSTVEWDVRDPLRSGASDAQLRQIIRDCVAAKKAGHGIDSSEFERPQRAMYQIGG